MGSKTPTNTYWPAIGILAKPAELALPLVLEGIAQVGWYQAIPFGWLSLLCLAYALGLLVQDHYNSNSWIRGLYRDLRRVFTIEATTDKSENNENDHHFSARIKFTRNMDGAIVVARVRSYAYGANPERKIGEFVIFEEQGLIASKDKTLNIPICDVFWSYPGWTPKSPQWTGGQSLISGSISVVEIEVRRGARAIQRERLTFLYCPQGAHKTALLFKETDGPFENIH